MAIELKVPNVGESIREVQIGQWMKRPGEEVRKDEVVVVIETDKATVEVPAPADGVLAKVLKGEREPALVGEVIGWVEVGAVAADAARVPSAGKAAVKAAEPVATPVAAKGKTAAPARVMPSARRELAQRGIDAADVVPSGPGGRLLKEDVLAHAAASTADSRPVERVPMTPIRRRIAERLVEAQSHAALLTTFNEIDMSQAIQLRKEHQDRFVARHGVKLGFMSIFVKAVIEALKQTPQLNAEVDGHDILYHNYFDIGIAVGGGKGLVVPVIRNAETLSFADIEKTIADLAARAKDNKIELAELKGGTFTISNGGIYGSLLSTPIVNPPQSGILGLHAIQDRPIALEGQVVIRPMMYVALTYDHRIVDGKEAVGFLKGVKDCVEQPARILFEI